MNTFLRRAATLTLVAPPLLIAGAGTAAAKGPDMTAPTVESYEVVSNDGDDDLIYFIEHEDATFTLRAHITDETGLDTLSGPFNPGNPTVVVSSTSTDQSVGFGQMKRVSGDAKDGWYEKVVTIPAGKASGTWEATISPLADTLGNSSGLGDFAFFGTLGVIEIVYGTPVTPDDPIFDDAEGTYSIPSIDGIDYLVDGVGAPTGTHEGSGEVTITAVAQEGFAIDGTSAWSHTFASRTVTAAPVTFTDKDGSSADTYTIPSATGVEYLAGGKVVPAGSHPASGTVTVSARATAGYELTGTSSWAHTFDALTSVTATAPTADATARSYTIPATTGVRYAIGGKTVAAGTYAGSGTVKVTASARAGYRLRGTSTWSLELPAAPFVDVKPGVEHYEHMVWMADAGISTGWKTSQGQEYRPLNSVNRDAMAAFLYRMAGSPKVTLPKTSPFTDVKPAQEHYTAIIWAYQEGITTGWVSKDGTRQFRPTTPINRDAMAAFLYRYAGEPAYTAPKGTCFTDVKPAQQFAKEMCWMKTEGISTGWNDGTYRPLQSVKRDAMAAFLHRYSQNT
ncbi:S-layer homology domain-containing protein [Brachybacterium squillarum]|uniref:S-layer homology domain-containing protein n=1 Tax=Brachybacterium squillarum TaxID=661979 RepID=UPI0022227E89|nr:S-layer homology domain-containing protein [Brachybacterium squillarum]MCW1805172.1 S-layer homology domain-containing protein [Brachybacterium squillarum]